MIKPDELAELKGIFSAYTIKPDKPVTLHSGKVSDYYIDARAALLMPKGLKLATRAIMKVMMQNNLDPASIGGIESGSISLAAAMCLEFKYPAFYVRKQNKEYGLKKRIEGHLHSPCIIVEDVTSTANSLTNAVMAVAETGNVIQAVITIVDRQDVDTSKLFEDVQFYSVFTAKELLELKSQKT